MRIAHSIAPTTTARPWKPTYHIAGRYTDNAGRKRLAERTWCGIVLGLGWRVRESRHEPNCQRCIEFYGAQNGELSEDRPAEAA